MGSIPLGGNQRAALAVQSTSVFEDFSAFYEVKKLNFDEGGKKTAKRESGVSLKKRAMGAEGKNRDSSIGTTKKLGETSKNSRSKNKRRKVRRVGQFSHPFIKKPEKNWTLYHRGRLLSPTNAKLIRGEPDSRRRR